jgi:hypothetical protein
MMLSLAAYSFRDFSPKQTAREKNPPIPRSKLTCFNSSISAARHNCAAELTSYYFPANVTDEFLLKLRRHAFLRGVPISGSAVGNTFTVPAGAKRDQEIASVKKWIDHAALLGAPHIRIFAGAAPKDMPMEEAKKLSIAATKNAAITPARKAVFLGLENHGGNRGRTARSARHGARGEESVVRRQSRHRKFPHGRSVSRSGTLRTLRGERAVQS